MIKSTHAIAEAAPKTKSTAPDKAAAPAGSAGSGQAAQGAPALVTLATAQRQDVPVTVQVNGSVVSLNSVDLRPQVTNTVRAVHIQEGQFVKAGQLLFTLDDRPHQANLAKARAQQQRDEATLADLERQYKRSQELVARTSSPEAQPTPRCRKSRRSAPPWRPTEQRCRARRSRSAMPP